MKTILVTGASGFVGSRFVQRWGGALRILAPTHSELDITDEASISRYFADNRPEIVLHMAAISNTMQCEQFPQESYKVNVVGAKNMAHATAASKARFIFFSSEQVYNGNRESGAMNEDVALSPESTYACQKLEAEQLVQELCPDAVILRATWMYDIAQTGLSTHANFVVRILDAIAKHEKIYFPVREFRGITNVHEAVELLPYTFELPAGIYNYGAENSLNTYETACCFFEMLNTGLKCDDIIAPDVERYPEHERNIAISNAKIFRASGGCICFCDTLAGLRIFIDRFSL